jgi:DNA-binding NarL/FixJ family response regulator
VYDAQRCLTLSCDRYIEHISLKTRPIRVPMRVLIADDHRIIRKSISSILQSRKDIRVCGEAVNGEEAVSKAQLLKPDLLILDISLPDSNGLEVATAIRAFLPKVPILLLSMYGGKQLSEEVQRRGFQGFISKSDAATMLLGAVDAIVNLKQSFYSYES